jgi:hypothetical protein
MQLFLLCGTSFEAAKNFLLDLGYGSELERVFDFIHYEDLVYRFCIYRDKKLDEAYRLINEFKVIINAAENKDTYVAVNQDTEFREFTQTYIENNSLGNEKTEYELRNTVEEHAAFFHKCSNTAWIKLVRLLKNPENSLAARESCTMKIIDGSVFDTFDVTNEKSVGKIEALNIENLVSALYEACEKYDGENFSQCNSENESVMEESDVAYNSFFEDVEAQLHQRKPIDRKLFIDCLLLTGHKGEQEIDTVLGESGFDSLSCEHKQDALVYEACMRAYRAREPTAFNYYCESIQKISILGGGSVADN